MRTTQLLPCSLAALALACCNPAHAAPSPYSTMIVFGDSLADAGQFGVRFTSELPNGESAPVSPTLLGQQLGVAPADLLPSTALGNPPVDGNNWATGGYRTDQILDSIIGSSQVGVPPLFGRERPGYLANGNRADPNALYYLTGGGNDFLQGLVTTPEQAAAAAGRLAASAQALQQGGARYIMVWMLPDLGLTPNYSGTPNQAGLSALSALFNQALANQLAQIDAQIIPLNVPRLLEEVVANPATYGLATGQNLVGTCYSGTQCSLNPAYGAGTALDDPDKLLFNDAVHPTATGQRLIADYGYSILSAPWEASLLPEMAQASLRTHQDTLRGQWQGAWQAPGEWQPILAASAGRMGIDEQGSSAKANAHGAGVTLGGSYRVSEAARLGLALGAYRQTLEAGPRDSQYGLNSYLASAFGEFRQGQTWADVTFTLGHLDYDSLKRRFGLGVSERQESASTTGHAVALNSRLGYDLAPASSRWQLAPFVSADWARAQVGSYEESSGRSTALGYGAQQRDSRRLGVGLQAALQVTPSTRLFAEAAREREFNDRADDVRMNLTSLPANRFTLQGYAQPGHLTRASVGVSQALAPGLNLSASYSLSKSDAFTQQGANLALSLDL
ncbi:autotransporter domain-containing protein [Pseudomonas sp. NPDC007930]|uniref:autotransporter domain-containing protein n=1 Tax=Pseudomonas sp. NPDC007930 TaxID=3364417 RepID=UPI0036E3E32C